MNSEPKALGRWTWYWPLRFFVAIMIMIYAIGKLTGGQFHTDPLPQEIAE